MPTVTVGPDAEHDYSALATALSSEEQSLSEDIIFELYPFEDTSNIDLAQGNWTLNGNRIILRTVDGLDQGVWDTSKYRLVVTDNDDDVRCLRDRVGVTIEGMQMMLDRTFTGTGSTFRSVVRADAGLAEPRYEDMILRLTTADANSADSTGLFENTTSTSFTAKLKNVIGIVEGAGALAGFNGADLEGTPTVEIKTIMHNCVATSVDPASILMEQFGMGLIGDGGPALFTAKNCWVNGVDGAGVAYQNLTAESDYLVSHDGSAPGSNSKTNTTPTVEDRSAGDFRPTEEDTVVVNAGVDLSGDADLSVTEDIRGVSRPQDGSYDIGFYELVPTVAAARLGLGFSFLE